ncbi:MAG: DUF4238 domain-containing protein [Candidatus Aadella gelida]|nr:DUF4238 domain-containing protein [Candidatus Aadella gelida]
MTQKKRNHHYIPNKSYLANFSDSKGKIWVLDSDDKIYQTSPAKTFKQKYFYIITLNKKNGGSLIVENTLAGIEGIYAAIYHNKINKVKPLTIHERAAVAVFLAAMYLRTKSQRENFRKALIDLRNKMKEWQVAFKKDKGMRDFYSRLPKSKNSKGITLPELEKGIKDFDEFHAASVMTSLPEVSQIIFDMKWCFVRIENTDEVFVTSDDPFRILRPESIKKYGPKAFGSSPGLLYKDTEITIPLSSKIALVAGWKLKDNMTIQADKKAVDQINIRTIMHASEKVVADNQEILKEILKKAPKKLEKSTKSW